MFFLKTTKNIGINDKKCYKCIQPRNYKIWNYYDIASSLLYCCDYGADFALYWSFRALEYGVVSAGDGGNGFPSGALFVGVNFSFYSKTAQRVPFVFLVLYLPFLAQRH